jgi:hypothetical protein
MFREGHPALEFCNVQNQIWVVALSVECASLLKWYLVEFTLYFTHSFFLLKPKRLVTKIPEGVISQLCPEAHFQKSFYCYYYYYYYYYFFIILKVKGHNFIFVIFYFLKFWCICMRFEIKNASIGDNYWFMFSKGSPF